VLNVTVISLSCIFLVYFLLRCSPRLCSWPSTFYHLGTSLSSFPQSQITTFMQMTLNFSSLFINRTSTQALLTYKTTKLLPQISWSGWLLRLLTGNSSKTEFVLIGLKNNLPNTKFLTQCYQLCWQTRHYLRWIRHLHRAVLSLSKSCYYHIRQLHFIRTYIDFTTARTTATSTVQYKLDYCNSLLNLPKYQIIRLQQM